MYRWLSQTLLQALCSIVLMVDLLPLPLHVTTRIFVEGSTKVGDKRGRQKVFVPTWAVDIVGFVVCHVL